MVHEALESLFGFKLTEAEDPEAARAKLGIGEPSDVANMVLFLASDEAFALMLLQNCNADAYRRWVLRVVSTSEYSEYQVLVRNPPTTPTVLS